MWKPIKNYEKLYEVSICGKVRSLKRNNTSGKILKIGYGKNGYGVVGLSKQSHVKHFYVHRLVAAHFCFQTEGEEVMHLDGNKRNNHADNLRWGTTMCNAAFRPEHGTAERKRGADNPLSKFTHEQEKIIRELKDGGAGYRELGRIFGCSHHTIARVCK